MRKVALRLKNILSSWMPPETFNRLAEDGMTRMGARPLKRIIQQRVEDPPIGDALLAGDFGRWRLILVDVIDNEIRLRKDETEDHPTTEESRYRIEVSLTKKTAEQYLRSFFDRTSYCL